MRGNKAACTGLSCAEGGREESWQTRRTVRYGCTYKVVLSDYPPARTPLRIRTCSVYRLARLGLYRILASHCCNHKLQAYNRGLGWIEGGAGNSRAPPLASASKERGEEGRREGKGGRKTSSWSKRLEEGRGSRVAWGWAVDQRAWPHQGGVLLLLA